MIIKNLHKERKHGVYAYDHNIQFDKLISILKVVSDQAGTSSGQATSKC